MDTPLRATTSSRKVPWTVIVLIGLWILAQLLDFINSRNAGRVWPNTGPEPIEVRIAEVLQFLYSFLIIVLIGYGLLRRLRFVWIVAFVWQSIEAGLGFVNLSLNDYELDAYTHFSGVPIYGIALPLTVASISFVLLLLPVTRRWIGSR